MNEHDTIAVFDAFMKKVIFNFMINISKKRNKIYSIELEGEQVRLQRTKEHIYDEHDCLKNKILISDIEIDIENEKFFNALLKLNSVEIKIIGSKVFNNKTNFELAGELGICEKTVRNILKKAKNKVAVDMGGR